MKTYTVKDTVGHISVVFAGSQSEKRVRNVTVLKGQSITVPCFYHRCDACTKQLCKGEKEANCPVRSNVASMSVSDDPVQGVFTVSMKDLQKKDSGMYMCVVELTYCEPPKPYPNKHPAQSLLNEFNHLFLPTCLCVQDTPGVSVKDNMMEAELGHSVTVHCFYSYSYRGREKKWCRSRKGQFCVTTWYKDTSQQTVTLKVDSTLEVFNRHFPVHISVTQKRHICLNYIWKFEFLSFN
uniref:Ig-like domain-containing protein n=1 Tax=Scleropages formosus TaxID=113540 RepID=A0A8C9VHN4_SCLFO